MCFGEPWDILAVREMALLAREWVFRMDGVWNTCVSARIVRKNQRLWRREAHQELSPPRTMVDYSKVSDH